MNSLKKYNLLIKEDINGHYLSTYIDVILCWIFLGASANEYFRWTFYEWSWKKRKTFVTSRKERKLWKENSNEIEMIFGDKAEFINQYSQFTKRHCLDLSKCNVAEFVQFVRNSKKIFIKYIWACGGLGAKIYTYTTDEDTEKFYGSLASEVKQYGLIAEEMIEQHPKMNLVGEKSVNTIRVATYTYNNEPHIIAATLRMGGNDIVDNWSSGGTCAAIDIKTGIVITPCVRDPKNQWMRHQVTGTIVPGFEIPHWDKVIQICLDAAKYKKGANYIGWDVAIRENDVVLVEANTNHGIFQIEDRVGKYQFIKQIRKGEYKL